MGTVADANGLDEIPANASVWEGVHPFFDQRDLFPYGLIKGGLIVTLPDFFCPSS